MTQPLRVLPADVYDTLEFSALAFGGIGKRTLYNDGNFPDDASEPCCAYGHLWYAGLEAMDVMEKVWNAFEPHDNDRAVNGDDRISFEEWCRRLNVVRGD